MKSLLKVLVLVLIIIGVQFFYGWGALFTDLKTFSEQHNNPAIFLLVMSLGCAVGLPISFCTLFAGAAFGAVFGSILSIIGIAISSFLGYFIGRFFFPKEIIEKIEKRFSISSRKTMFDLNFYVRAVPGASFSMQNFILGAMASELKMYMLVGISIQGAIAIAMNVLGASFTDDSCAKYFAIAVLIVVIIAMRWGLKKLVKLG